MWLSSLWRSRNRFSLDELRYLTDQLMKVQVVNEVNKDFVIEAVRAIAELIIYGDQHDSSYFEFFMEKQVMGEFVRILKISRTVIISLQLLQTMSIMIQNIRNEQSIYYMFSNENINCLITYPFDFRNEELLSYYMSFLRAISGKLNRDTISLLVNTQKDELVSFPLYAEAIRFAFHEEGMIRTAVRALTLNIYHVGDESVNKYVATAPHADYFSNLINFFRGRCIALNELVSQASVNLGAEVISSVLSAVDEIEDNLYYFSDVVSAGIPDVGMLITEKILKTLIFPLILPSLRSVEVNETKISASTSLYLLCCILRIVKIKDLANTVAASLLCSTELFLQEPEAKVNGHVEGHELVGESNTTGNDNFSSELRVVDEQASLLNISGASGSQSETDLLLHTFSGSCLLRDTLLSYITSGDDIRVSGSLSLLATLLQTKELDESMLDALGILPQRKQHKKFLLQALVGEESGEEQLFSSRSSLSKSSCNSELENCLQKLKDHYGLFSTSTAFSSNLRLSRNKVVVSPNSTHHEVLDALVSLFCRSNISAETLWDGGWLLRQLLPYSEAKFNSNHIEKLNDSFRECASQILKEARGTWPDVLINVICDEWSKCKRAMEASSPRKDPLCMLLPRQTSFCGDGNCESSFTVGARMGEMVKVFVLLHQLHYFSLGKTLPDQPPVLPPVDVPEKCRSKLAGLDILGPKPGTEFNLVPCRIAFERGKERHFSFLAVSVGMSGSVILAEELPLRAHVGVVRVTAPLAGCNPRIDEKHSRWLHLRIRPISFPFTDSSKNASHGKLKSKALVDGRWTLAFRDPESCKLALSMIHEEINLLSSEVERRLKPLLDREINVDSQQSTTQSLEGSRTPLNIL